MWHESVCSLQNMKLTIVFPQRISVVLQAITKLNLVVIPDRSKLMIVRFALSRAPPNASTPLLEILFPVGLDE